MKFAFCTEDPSDDFIACELMKRVTGSEVERDSTAYRIPKGGWTQARKLAPMVARRVFRSDLSGAVFMIDNDGARPEHVSEHDRTPVEGCRLCDLRIAANTPEVESWDRPSLPPLTFIFAVPVETIESWLLLGRGADAPIAHAGSDPSERRELKRRLYGNERADRELRLKTASSIIASLDVAAVAAQSQSFSYFVKQLQTIASATPAG